MRISETSPRMQYLPAFSLIELILVILIVGIVYSLAIGGIERAAKAPEGEALTLQNLPEYLLRHQQRDHRFLACTDRCSRCTLYAGERAVETTALIVSPAVRAYRFDYLRGSDHVVWQPLFNDEGVEQDLCFRYDLYPDGSRSDMIVVDGDTVVDLGGPFSPVTVHPNLQAAVDARRSRYEEAR